MKTPRLFFGHIEESAKETCSWCDEQAGTFFATPDGDLLACSAECAHAVEKYFDEFPTAT